MSNRLRNSRLIFFIHLFWFFKISVLVIRVKSFTPHRKSTAYENLRSCGNKYVAHECLNFDCSWFYNCLSVCKVHDNGVRCHDKSYGIQSMFCNNIFKLNSLANFAVLSCMVGCRHHLSESSILWYNTHVKSHRGKDAQTSCTGKNSSDMTWAMKSQTLTWKKLS